MRRSVWGFLLVFLLSGGLVSCGSDDTRTASRREHRQQDGASSKRSLADDPRVTNREPTTTAQEKSPSDQSPRLPRLVPFRARDVDGTVRSSDEWVGQQPLVVNFWGTWCGPCRREAPDLARLYKEYRPKGVEIIGMAVNDTPEKVRAFTEQYNMDWVMLLVDQDTAIRFQLRSVPMTLFVNRDGYIVDRLIGVKPYSTLKRSFESIL